MNTRKIIIVDDKPAYRKSLKDILNIIANVDVIGEASDGEEYLQLLKTMEPDITFMDIEMPRMGGIEATRRALKLNKNLVIIGLSLFQNDNFVEKMMDAGACGYLLKIGDNFDILKNIIDNPRADYYFSDRLAERYARRTKQKTILVTDDFETTAKFIASALQNKGYKVLVSNSGKEALGFVMDIKHQIDLFVFDYNMPEMNGAELLAIIKKTDRYSNTPALILCSEENHDKEKRAKLAGATGWIKKPFMIEKFLNIVAGAVSN